jgi:two-component system NtrC family sensor kinase
MVHLIIILFWVMIPNLLLSQTQVVSYYTTVPVLEYGGCRFRLSALVRVEVKDTSAKTQLWARVDNPVKAGFFDNMDNRPITSAEWKTYTIEGVIDSNSTRIAFGVLVLNSGSFFYDNFQLDVETKREGWKTIYSNNFEEGQAGFNQGIGKGTSLIDTMYTSKVVQINENKNLKIEAPDALEYYQKILLKPSEPGIEREKVKAYLGLIKLYENNIPKNLHKILEVTKEGYDYSQKINSRKDIAKFARLLFTNYFNLGNSPEAIKYLLISIKEYEYLKDTIAVAAGYNQIGVINNDNQKNYKEALKYHKKALMLRQAMRDENMVGQSLVNLCYSFKEMGQLDSADWYITKAIHLYSKLGDRAVDWGLALSYIVKAELLFKMGEIDEQNRDRKTALINFTEALDYYKKSQNLYRNQWSAAFANQMNVEIGMTYFKLGKTELADSFLLSGLKYLEEADAKRSVLKDKSNAFLYLSKIDSIRGDWKMANTNFKRHIEYDNLLYNEESIRNITASQMQFEYDIKEATLQAEQEKKELLLKKELELKSLTYEYEKKKAAAKNEKEREKLKHEQELKQQEIEAEYAQKTARVEAEQKRKEAVAKVEQEKRDALNASSLALSREEVKRKNQERNYFILAFALLSALLGFIVFGYFQKQRANTLLQKQKAEIDQKSKELEKSFAELKSTQYKLIQSEKMASLGELTAGIAHEIQNPLNFVNNFSEVSNELIDEMNEELNKGKIKEAKDISSDIKQNLEKIIHHGKRADSIVKAMLEHSRKETGQKEITDINALCDEYLRLAYHGLRAKDKNFTAAMETHFDPDLPKLNVIPQDLGRVFLNIINNAFHAVNERHNKDSDKTQEKGYKPKISVTTKLNGDKKLEVSIKDNGFGIPDTIKEKIFQPFFTTKPTGQGTGLGLSLSYDIVKTHGGELRVETKEGEGSTFIIELPVT